MSNINITPFFKKEFGEIRVIEKNNEPWFVGKDVEKSLGYKNVNDALFKHVDEEDKESLIKNIKAGKGAVIDKKKKPSLDKSDESADVTKDKDDKNNNNNNNSNNNNNR